MSLINGMSWLNDSISERISEAIRLCPICYRRSEQRRFLCGQCAAFVQRNRYRQWARFQDGIPVLSLFEWNERQHSFFHEYASSLKGGGSSLIYESIAADLLALRASLKKPATDGDLRQWAIVPAPGAGGIRDHAEELAFQIAKLAGAQFLPCFERFGQQSQKSKSMSQRWAQPALQIRPGDHPPIMSGTVYIFIDDVITTGSTALFAHKCLGKPEHFEIWTIFNRPRLRGRK